MSYCGDCEDCVPTPEPEELRFDRSPVELAGVAVAQIDAALGTLTDVRREARALARKGHPAKKAEGERVLALAEAEIRRLSAERRDLIERYPGAIQ